MLLFLDRLGNWNPQLLRELKGRFKPTTVLFSLALSIIGQMLLMMSAYGRLPLMNLPRVTNRYCTGPQMEPWGDPQCITDAVGNFLIHWERWWIDVFVQTSLVGSFLLVVIGVYLIASDLSREEQRGTLNFIRLSPRSTQEILVGKLLGVPSLLYLTILVALPLHLWAAFSGAISATVLMSFYVTVLSSCLVFYSTAILLSLVFAKFSGLQVWLSTGFVFCLLLLLYNTSSAREFPINWIIMFSPVASLTHLLDTAFATRMAGFRSSAWFGLPFAQHSWSLTLSLLLHNGLWLVWLWCALERRFRTPGNTLFSKRQSYKLTASFAIALLGFAAQRPFQDDSRLHLLTALNCLLVLGFILCMGLMAALSPQQQDLQDWARYRHRQTDDEAQKHKRRIWADLLFGKKSPMSLAIAVNAAIVSLVLLAWVASWTNSDWQAPAIAAILLNAGAILVCVAIAQVMLTSSLKKRVVWTVLTVSGLILLPPVALFLAFMNTTPPAAAWLFSAFPWVAVERTSAQTLFLVLLGQFSTFGLLSLRTAHQLRQSGASETKALLSAP